MIEIAAPQKIDGARILIVDGDPGVRALLLSILRRLGYLPEAVGSVGAALDHVRDSAPDVVLLGMQLPGRDGHDLLEWIRTDGRKRLLPVIMLEDAPPDDDRPRALAAGVSAYVSKPFDAEVLDHQLRSLLRLKHVTDELEDGGRVLVAIARTLEAKDSQTAGHSERVSSLAGRLGARLGMSHTDLCALEHGGLVHDIGKVGIRDGLLLKAGPLDADEWLEVQRHPEIGLQLVEGLLTMSHTLSVIHFHHERMDGSGYPLGLSGEQIPVVARIAAIADVYDALTSPRPYRAAYPAARARSIIQAEAQQGLLDEGLLREFLPLVPCD